GERNNVRAPVMIAMAKVYSDAEVKAAADYFAALKPTPGYTKVIEAATVPKTYVGGGAMRFAVARRGNDPIRKPIIVLPQNEERAKMRDPKTGFIDYVPPGSIKKGAALAAGGNGKTVACTICHGPTLQGLGEVPAISGRPATYMFRQLNDIKNGKR